MTTSYRYEGDPVAVIGNGPVGQTTALLLADGESRWSCSTPGLNAI